MSPVSCWPGRRRAKRKSLCASLWEARGSGSCCCISRGGPTHLIFLTAPPALALPLDRAASVLDLRVLAFTGLAALASALISALVPALRYSRTELVLGIKSESGRSS